MRRVKNPTFVFEVVSFEGNPVYNDIAIVTDYILVYIRNPNLNIISELFRDVGYLAK